jgi:hypothetical protein
MHKIIPYSINTLRPGSIELSILSSAGTGEMLKNAEITGNPVIDLIVKIGVPIVSGVLLPIVKEWIQSRAEKRKERKSKKTVKQTNAEK